MRSVPSINCSPVFKKILLGLTVLILPILVYSQHTDSLYKKLSPGLEKELGLPSEKPRDFIVVVSDPERFKAFLVKQPGIITKQELIGGIFLISTTNQLIRDKLVKSPEVLFIDRQRTPKEEVAVSNLDLSANKLTTVHRWFPQYDGEGLNVSVKENLPDTLDIDFKGRYISSTLASNILSSHATITATIIAGAGNSYYEGRGAAKASGITSFSFSNLLPENDAVYQQYNISVQNHSYGTGIENYYGADALAYDASVIARPVLLHVFSAGNSGTQTSTIGPYSGVNGYANLTGSFKMAKNIITVGHVDSFGIVLPASSKGPAYDGRVKPELVAFGLDGSSGAAAITSGTALLLQQAYRDIYGNLPSSALVKAVLLNSADDVGPAGIDFSTGYGNVNAFRAMQTIVNAQMLSSSITTGAVIDHLMLIPANIKQVKITLAWNDPPATANAAKALRNDLDLELSLPALGQTWQPWVLNHYPHADSLSKLPVRKRDSLNTVEQVTIDNPAVGNYIIRVKGINVPASSPQSYHIAYQLDTLQRFTWYYPTRLDNLFGGRSNTIRWQNSFSATGQLEWSVDNGTSWQMIANNVDLQQGFYKWNPPVNFRTALLRMNIGSQSFVTDTFTISTRFNVNIGFNCPDSFALWWNNIPGISSYQLYRLGDRYMEPFMQTSDTLVVLKKQNHPSFYYAAAPLINGKTGLRTYAYDYTNQGVGCYIKSFYGVLNNAAAFLTLELGTTYNIRKITWEKLTPSGYVALQDITSIQGLQFNYTDNTIRKGLNIYRVRIELTNGTIIYSQPEIVYYFDNAPYLLYPNPVRRGQFLNLVNNDPGIITVRLILATGAILYEIQNDDMTVRVPTHRLQSGVYFLRIFKQGKPEVSMKVLVF